MRAFKRPRATDTHLTSSQWFFELIGMSIDLQIERYKEHRDKKLYKEMVAHDASVCRRLMMKQILADGLSQDELNSSFKVRGLDKIAKRCYTESRVE